jgi:hypothetical protein
MTIDLAEIQALERIEAELQELRMQEREQALRSSYEVVIEQLQGLLYKLQETGAATSVVTRDTETPAISIATRQMRVGGGCQR